MAEFLNLSSLQQGVVDIKQSPANLGILDMIVIRPEVDQRLELDQGYLDTEQGLVGDSWKSRGSSRTTDGNAHPEMQINMMNSRAISLIARDRSRWKLAGDQLFVDLDLSEDNLPAGTRLSIGNALLEVSAIPHTGCKKFASRYGVDAVKFVSSSLGKKLRIRGLNARIIKSGAIRKGDLILKVS